MSWATQAIEQLKQGKEVKIHPHGNSMTGKINDGDLVTIIPLDRTLEVGDIVLCKVNGKQYLHLVKAISGERYQIGNNKGGINGWVGVNSIFGRVVRVESGR